MAAASELVAALRKQDEIMNELLDILVRQRDALRSARFGELQGLMSEMRHVSVRSQAIETKRARVAAELSRELQCEPVVSRIAAELPAEEASPLLDAARVLMKTVESLKVEMAVLPRLMEEAHALNEMLIAEWRKLGEKSVGFGQMGAFDTRI